MTHSDQPPTETPTPSQTVTPVDPPRGTVLETTTTYIETVGPAIEGGIDGEESKDHYATVISTEGNTDRFFTTTLDDETVAFIDATTFPDEVLLVAQKYLPSISLELALRWAVLQDWWLVARVETRYVPLLDVSANGTLIARLSLGGGPPPEDGLVTFVDHEGEVIPITIE